jgi:hypothetical protein
MIWFEIGDDENIAATIMRVQSKIASLKSHRFASDLRQRRRRDIYVVKERPSNQAPYGGCYESKSVTP